MSGKSVEEADIFMKFSFRKLSLIRPLPLSLARFALVSLTVTMLAGFSSSANAADALLINGAGATFPQPIYSKWFSEYAKKDPSTTINYQAIGSGGGIRQLIAGTVHFGASDEQMRPDEEAKLPKPAFHVPTVLGAVVLSYNLPVSKPLNLTGELVADIFLGKITKWNDPKIAQANPGVELPSEAIIPAYRSDGSGTTAIFTDYLSKVSPEWKAKVGQGKAMKWPTGLGAKGNAGVAGLIKQNLGTIGYIELVFAQSNGLPTARLRNRAGQYTEASVKSVSAAAASLAVKDIIANGFKASITDTAGKEAYPISAFTWLLVFREMPKAEGEKLVKFLQWSLSPEAQKMAEELHYAPLPKPIADAVLKQVQSITLK
jgi:phosphate transport system substrate-binding protein